RIDVIGRMEFDEARTVLQQDGYLLPDADERGVYVEFAAFYLELRQFQPALRSVHFPALRHFDVIDGLFSADLDADGLFAPTRLPGAQDPVDSADDRLAESHDFYWKLVRKAAAASAAGNTVGAAILRTHAARVAPAELTRAARAEAQNDLQRLAARLE